MIYLEELELSNSQESMTNNIYHEYQSIVDIKTGDIFGYEALLRSKVNVNLPEIFQSARDFNVLFKLDSISIQKALKEMNKFLNCNLFINIFPSTVIDSNFISLLEEIQTVENVNNNRIVFELNEDFHEHNLWSLSVLKETVNLMKGLGYKLALDDVGTEAASLKNVIEYEPDYIKLDRYFAQSLTNSPEKQRIVKLLAEFKSNHTKLVLEGIETEEDLFIANELGVDLGQGFYISRPIPFN